VHYEFPPSDGPLDEWFAPLEAVARLIEGNPRFPFFDLGDFMVMERLVRPPRPTIVLYKHYFTRRYLNLDEWGTAYRYIAPPVDSDRSGRYVRHRDLASAIHQLQLLELPWMKPGLEARQHEGHCEDPWPAQPDGEHLGDVGGELGGHLRLV
jgi:hypothetical protein